MAIKGQIYDVSQSRMFYGPGGPYALFAGKDASRALAKMSFEEKDLTGDLEGLGPFELDALQDWEYKFMGKYVKVGQIKKPAVKEVEVSGSDNAPDAEHSTREVQVNEESSVDVAEAVNIAKEVAEGTTNDETQVANGTLDGEEAAKPKENGVEPKEDIDGTKDPAEISEALEDALVEKKNVEFVHEAKHAVPVA